MLGHLIQDLSILYYYILSNFTHLLAHIPIDKNGQTPLINARCSVIDHR